MPGVGADNSDDSDDVDGTDKKKYSECAELSFIATKDIKAGEEICISYIPSHGKYAGVDERRHMLRMNWLPGDCMCARCREEDPESVSSAETSVDQVAGDLGNLKISTSYAPQALTKNQRKNKKKKRERERLAKQVAREQHEEGEFSKDHQDQEENDSGSEQ